MHRTRTNEELLELLLLGATWVQEKGQTTSGWKGNGILRTVKVLGGLSDSQFKAVSEHPSQDLRDFFVPRSALIWPQGRRNIKAAIESDKLLVVMIDTVMFSGDRIFAPNGYRIRATARGMAHAHAVAGKYKPELTVDTFWGQWQSHRRQMGSLFAGQGAPGQRGTREA